MPRKMAVLSLFFCILFIFVSVTIAAEWYAGGTLHGATIAEWKEATDANKLATCVDFIASIHQLGILKFTITTIESIKPYANQLVVVIDATVADSSDFDNKPVSEIAAASMLMMDWLEGVEVRFPR